MSITYRRGYDITVAQLTELYQACTLGARRPLNDVHVVQQMIDHANLLISAWDGAQLVGLCRAMTDFGYVCYIADIAVRNSHQRQDIGRTLIQQTRDALGPHAMIVLIAAPQAVDYYPRLGFTRHESAWILKAGEPLK